MKPARLSQSIMLVALILAAAGFSAHADETWWQHDPAAPGDWFDPANWTAGVPHSGRFGHVAYIDNGGVAEILGGLPTRISPGLLAQSGELDTTAVPESAAMSLLVLGGLAIFWRKRTGPLHGGSTDSPEPRAGTCPGRTGRRGPVSAGLVCAAVLSLICRNAWAQTLTADWLNGPGYWNDPTNWSTAPKYPNNEDGLRYHAVIAASGPSYGVISQTDVTVDSVLLNSASGALLIRSGRFEAADITLLAGRFEVSGATLANATVHGPEFATVRSTSGQVSTFDGVRLDTDVWAYSPLTAPTLELLNGHFVTLRQGSGLMSSEIRGSGTVGLHPSAPLEPLSEVCNSLVIGPGITVHDGITGGILGSADPESLVVNRGTVQCSGSGIDIVAGQFINEGALVVYSNAELTVSNLIGNAGTLWIPYNGDIRIQGGTYVIDQPLNLQSQGGLALNGTYTVGAPIDLRDEAFLGLNGDWTLTQPITLDNGGLALNRPGPDLEHVSMTKSRLYLRGEWNKTHLDVIRRTGTQIHVSSGGTYDNTGQQLFTDPQGDRWRLSGGTILGGTISARNGGTLDVHGIGTGLYFSTLQDLVVDEGVVVSVEDEGLQFINSTNRGIIDITQAGTLVMTGSTNEGTVNVGWGEATLEDSTNAGTILVHHSLRLDQGWANTGTIHMAEEGWLDARIYLRSPTTAFGTISGGNRDSAIGVWSNFTGSQLSGIEGPATVLLRPNAVVENTDDVLTLASGGPDRCWYLEQAKVIGGRIRSADGTYLRFREYHWGSPNLTTLDGVTLEANATVQGPLNVVIENGLTMDGATITLDAPADDRPTTLDFVGTSSLDGTGGIVFDGSGTGMLRPTDGTFTIGPGITVRTGASGGVVGASTCNLVNQGIISAQTPGQTIAVTAGLLANQGTLEAREGATLAISDVVLLLNEGLVGIGPSGTVQVGGHFVQYGASPGVAVCLAGLVPGQEFGRLEITGSASLGGTLKIILAEGYLPAVHDSFQIITCSNRSDEFWSVTGADNVGGYRGLWFELDYEADSLTLLASALDGDANLDGCVDGLDYNAWSLHYGTSAGWTGADYNGDDTVDGLDYNTWSLNYQVGCAGAAVPEPATLALLALGVGALLGRRKGRGCA